MQCHCSSGNGVGVPIGWTAHFSLPPSPCLQFLGKGLQYSTGQPLSFTGAPTMFLCQDKSNQVTPCIITS